MIRYTTAQQAATATALLFFVPQLGGGPSTVVPNTTAPQALGAISKDVAAAVAPNIYSPVALTNLAGALLDAATMLVRESKSIDRDFAEVLDEEFWNLV